MTRLPPEERPSAEELRSGTAGIACPNCGCRDFRSGRATPMPSGATKRYEYCRNCGKGVVTKQPPKQIVREVKSQRDEDGPALRLVS